MQLINQWLLVLLVMIELIVGVVPRVVMVASLITANLISSLKHHINSGILGRSLMMFGQMVLRRHHLTLHNIDIVLRRRPKPIRTLLVLLDG